NADVEEGKNDSNNETKKSKGDSNNENKEKKFDVNKEYNLDGFIFEVETIEVTEKDVKIYVSAENKQDESLTFYPDQGEIVIGDKQLSSNFLMNKGDSWGDIHSGVKKSGMFKYVADDEGLKPSEITEIKLIYGNIYYDNLET